MAIRDGKMFNVKQSAKRWQVYVPCFFTSSLLAPLNTDPILTSADLSPYDKTRENEIKGNAPEFSRRTTLWEQETPQLMFFVSMA